MILYSYLNFIFLFSISALLNNYALCQRSESPRLTTRDGNLLISSAFNKNITLEVSGDQSCINVGPHNLIQVVQMAKNASSLVHRMSSILVTNGNLGVSRISRQLYGSHGILRRLTNLENERGNNNGSSARGRVPKVQLSRLRRRIAAVEVSVQSILVTLNKDSCSSNPCKNGGTCLENMKGFHCMCQAGWEGTQCDIDVDECTVLNHSGLGCQNGATCVNSRGSYRCLCISGWFGLHCTSNTMNDCISASNEELCGHGTCIPQSSTQGRKCICDQGWRPNTAGACTEDVNECLGNHHPCSANPYVPCLNTPGSFVCGSCPTGYSGNGYYCMDIDECLYGNGGCSVTPRVQCINTLGSSICGECPPGFTGNGITCTYMGVCAVNNGGCHPLALCIANPMISSTYVRCRCSAGYTGLGYGLNGCSPVDPTASTPTPGDFLSVHCQPNPCQHGTCHDLPEGYLCICNPRYTGANCEHLRNPCSPNPCQNSGTCISDMATGGYRCECTNYYTGTTCETQTSSCGGILEKQEGSIVYPETNLSSSYNHNSKCAWVILTAPDKVLSITFSKFNLEQGVDCLYDWLQIHDGRNSANQIIGRYCGNTLPNGGNITSTHNVLYLWFRSDHTISNDGFALHWRSIDPVCGGEIQDKQHGIITSPGSPGKYPPNRDCYWKITTPINKRIQIHFFTMQIADNNNDCNSDYVKIFDGATQDDAVLGRYCNTTNPAPLLTSGSHALVYFHSDSTINDNGFQLSYAVVDGLPGCGVIYMQDRGEITPPIRSGEYVPNIMCEYKIALPAGTNIRITFLSFDLEESPICSFDYVAVYDGESSDSNLIGKFCGKDVPATIVSSTNNLMIVFKSDYTITGEGFRIEYEIVCHKLFTESTGTIKSPGYPNIYPNDRKCTYLISLPIGKAIYFSFIDFDIEETNYPACTYDSVKFYDGDNNNSTLIGNFCGKNEVKPADFVSTHNYLYFELTTDSSVSGTGFMANYVSIDKECGGILKDLSGTIEYPDTRKNTVYGNNIRCIWVLSAPPGYVIQMHWMTFDLEKLNNCYGDYVEIYDNNTLTHDSELLGRFCGTTIPPALTSLTNMITVLFRSDDSLVSNGFSMSYMFMESRKVCGGTYMKSHGVITSPGWPNLYPSKKDCKWIIKVPEGHQIMLNITEFQLEVHSNCFGDYLEIRNGGYGNAPLIGKFCGTEIPPTIPSMTNSLYLSFHSDISRVYSGFKITWDSTATGCGGILTSSRGSIISPNYPQKYGHNAECYWKISTSAGSVIEIVFADLELEPHGQCQFDYVEIFNGDFSSPKSSLGRFCSQALHPGSIVSTTNNVFIKFRTDSYTAGHGFMINYNTVCNRNVSGNTGVIESPNFPAPYPDFTDCTWRIVVPRGNKINITFSHLDLEKGFQSLIAVFHAQPRIRLIIRRRFNLSNISNTSCNYDYVQLKDGKDVNYTNKYCGNTIPPLFRSSDNNVFVHFHADHFHHLSGFRLEWVVDGCGGNLYHPFGTITSPGYPKFYSDGTDCEWVIQVDTDKSIELKINEIDMEMLENCLFDSFTAYNGPTTDSPELIKLCHSTKGEHTVVTSTGNYMYIKFETDNSYSGKGFSASYKSVASKCGGLHKSVKGIITSPNYPNNYDNNMECLWIIEVPATHIINLTFVDVDIAKSWNTNCSDVVNIYEGDKPDKDASIGSICDSNNQFTSNYTSKGNKLLIEFKSDSREAAKGFKAIYSMACGARIEAKSEGTISSHTGMNMIEHMNNCTWIIVAERPDQKVTLTITYMYILNDGESDCGHLYLEILNGDSEDAPRIGKYCGNRVPPTIVSTGNALTVVSRSRFQLKGTYGIHYSVLTSACGGELSSEEGLFSSPQYPDSYPVNVECVWIVAASPGNQVTLTFNTFDLDESENCDEDFVEIRENNSSGSILGIYCGKTIPSNTTIDKKIWIKFRSDGDGVGLGFIAFYSYERDSDIQGQDSGQITSPLYPRAYAREADFSWRITVPFGSFISLAFKEFQIDQFTSACYISLKVFDGFDGTAPMLLEACGSEIPKPIQTTSNLVYITLSTDNFNKGTTFLIDWIRVPSEQEDVLYDGETISEECGKTGLTFLPMSSFIKLQSPGYPNGYGPNLFCEWIYESDPSHHLVVKFTAMSLEESSECFMDKLTLYSGVKGSEDWKKIGRDICLSNATDMSDIKASNLLKIVFRSDISNNRSGFEALIYTECGGSLTAPSGTLSPSYLEVARLNLYRGIRRYIDCQWNITVKPGRTIKLEFISMNISNTDNKCSNYVMLKNGESMHSPLLGSGKYCGSDIPAENLVTTGNHAFINYHAMQSVPFHHTNDAFLLKYSEQSRECGSRVQLTKEVNSTVIMSPNYPNIPHPHTECTWVILTNPGDRLRIDFTDRFDLTANPDCDGEYVEIRDGGTEFSNSLGKFCLETPGTIKTTSNIVFVKFSTDVTDPRNGFKATISIDVCGGTVYGHSGAIKSPDHLSLSIIQNNIVCEWRVIGPKDHSLWINLNDISLPSTPNCNSVSLQIFDVVPFNNTANPITERICGRNDSLTYQTSMNEAIIKMNVTRGSLKQVYHGFMLTYNSTQESCGGVLTAPSGYLEGFKSHYSGLYSPFCEWRITVPKGRRIKVEVPEEFSNMTANFQRMGFYDGHVYGSMIRFPTLGGSSHVVQSSSNKMLVYYWSRSYPGYKPFKARYTSDELSVCEGALAGDEGTILPPSQNISTYYCEYLYEPQADDAFEGKTLAMFFKNVETGSKTSMHCRFSSSRILVSFEQIPGTIDLCGNYTKEKVVTSPFRRTTVKFIQKTVRLNFQLDYKVYSCGGVVNNLDDPDIFNLQKHLQNHTGPVYCSWALVAPEGQTIQMSSGRTAFTSQSCDEEYMKIRGGRFPISPLMTRMCYNRLPPDTLTSSTRYVWVEYHADNYSATTTIDIKITSDALGCGRVLTNPSRVFQTPNFPHSYGEKEECSWEIWANPGYRIKLSFINRFFLETSPNCTKDFVEIFDYTAEDWKSLGKLCGRNLPGNFESSSNKMKLLFRSDEGVNGDGFQARWEPFCGGTFEVVEAPKSLISPGYPVYSRNLSCTYEFVAAEGQYINLNFTKFLLENGNNQRCQYDNVTLEQEESYFMMTAEPSIYCGNRSPGYVRMRNHVTMKFQTDLWIQKPGFALQYSIDVCGASINTSQQIHSPSGNNLKYHQNIECLWNITAPGNKLVVVRFTSFLLEHSMDCSFDSLSAYEGTEVDPTKRLVHLCGDLTNFLPVIKSTGNSMILKFVTDGSNEMGGFSADITFTIGEEQGCGGNKVATNENTELKIFPLPLYEPFLDCHWTIKAPVDNLIRLKFSEFNISYCADVNQTTVKRSYCSCDFLEIHDGPGFHSPLIGRYCGDRIPSEIVSTSNVMWIWFKSDGTISNTGVTSTYVAMPSPCGLTSLESGKEIKELTSPGYNQGVVTKGIRCKWIINATTQGEGIHVKLINAELEGPLVPSQQCSLEKLEISDKKYNFISDSTSNLIIAGQSTSTNHYMASSYPQDFEYAFCGSMSTFNIYSFSDKIAVTLTTSLTASDHKGFKLEYSAPGCSRNYSEPYGRIVNFNMADLSCLVTIQVPINNTISLYMHNAIVTTSDCEKDYIEIRDGDSENSPIVRKICGVENPMPVFSTTNALRIHTAHESSFVYLSSDMFYTTTDKGRGCGGTLFDQIGFIFSPMYPEPYRINGICEWIIKTPYGTKMELTFTIFSMGSPALCATDYIELLDNQDNVITKYCGLDKPAIHRGTNYLRLVQHSSINGNGGWTAQFRSTKDDSQLDEN